MAEITITREQVEEVLNKIRPALQADGGDIELIAVEGKNARVALQGHCVGCPSSMMTLKFGVERALREEIPGFGELIPEMPKPGGHDFDY
jgi:Fe-S cluster biogenesis protein NfuA